VITDGCADRISGSNPNRSVELPGGVGSRYTYPHGEPRMSFEGGRGNVVEGAENGGFWGEPDSSRRLGPSGGGFLGVVPDEVASAKECEIGDHVRITVRGGEVDRPPIRVHADEGRLRGDHGPVGLVLEYSAVGSLRSSRVGGCLPAIRMNMRGRLVRCCEE